MVTAGFVRARATPNIRLSMRKPISLLEMSVWDAFPSCYLADFDRRNNLEYRYHHKNAIAQFILDNQDIIETFNEISIFSNWLTDMFDIPGKLRIHPTRIIRECKDLGKKIDKIAERYYVKIPYRNILYNPFLMAYVYLIAPKLNLISGLFEIHSHTLQEHLSPLGPSNNWQGAVRYARGLDEILEQAASFLEPYIRPNSIQLVLPRAAGFRHAVSKRAKQGFSIATDRDLVYIIDPYSPELFLRLWKNQWSKKIERLAVLFCSLTSLYAHYWDADSFEVTAEEVWGSQEESVSAFVGVKLKEILLVIRMDGQFNMLPRDAFGFVDYELIRTHPLTEINWNTSELNLPLLETLLESVEHKLRKMFPGNLGRKIKIRYVVDVDCEAIGDYDRYNGSIAHYRRVQRK
ncbi:hypothetical protein F5Y14DRAFT_419260 [Nemania sp. NC0429]|nr:hypothetical protein F5Y14DRAFT_419260 [Nemania sp. NC0429]